MPHPSFHSSWNTDKEIEFLSGLGTHTGRNKDRVALLKNYIKNFNSRKIFTSCMDREKIINAANAMLFGAEKVVQIFNEFQTDGIYG